MKSLITLLALGCTALAAHADTVVTSRATELQAKPQSDAATVATLAADSKVERLRTTGGWSEVKTGDGKSGWVRMMHLKAEAAAGGDKPASGGNLLGSLLTSGRTSGDATVTTSVKGLDKEDLEKAQPNTAELEKMKGYAVNKSVAQSFAQRSKLHAAKVEYLEAAPARNEGVSNSFQGG